MVHPRKIQSQLCLGAIALSSSLAIVLPSVATVPEDSLILIEVEEVSTEGYNPPTFVFREGQSPQSPVSPVPLDWIGPDSELKTNPDHPDINLPNPIAPATPDPLQQQEVPTDKD
jgi:hypothetical protein